MPIIFKYSDVISAVFKGLQNLGGSGSNIEIKNQVIQILGCTQVQVDNALGDGQNELDVKLGYSRTLLKKGGVITNPRRGYWILVGDYRNPETTINPNDIFSLSYERNRRNDSHQTATVTADDTDIPEETLEDIVGKDEIHETNEEVNEVSFKTRLLDRVQELTSFAFETLCAYVLGKLDLQVVTTQQTRDEGLDGIGICKVNKVLQFSFALQCKRYADNNSVQRPAIQNFRGAMAKRGIDRGIFITTSTFTDGAKEEAKYSSINLIDGDEFADFLFEQHVGYLETRTQSESGVTVTYEIDENFFNTL